MDRLLEGRGELGLKPQLAVGLIQGVCSFHCYPPDGELLFRLLVRDKQPPKLGDPC